MFSTASGFGDLLVISAPPGPPLIQGDIRVRISALKTLQTTLKWTRFIQKEVRCRKCNIQDNYQPGDLVHLNCSSRDSKPAADLSWKINGQTADSSYIIPHPGKNWKKSIGLELKIKFLKSQTANSSRKIQIWLKTQSNCEYSKLHLKYNSSSGGLDF